jgi:hypothetical protein
MFLFFSCEKPVVNNWRYENIVVYSTPGYVADTITYISYYDKYSNDQILQIIKTQTFEGYQVRKERLYSLRANANVLRLYVHKLKP